MKIRNAYDESGAVTVELLVLFPLLLLIPLITLQLALILQAYLIVNYSAYRAARCAIVVIPEPIRSVKDNGFEGANQIHLGDEQSPKLQIIRRAAALPLIVISPKWTPELLRTTGTTFKPHLVPVLTAVGIFTEKDMFTNASDFVSQAMYAFDEHNLDIQIQHEDPRNNDTFRVHELIRVTVKFKFKLMIPGANKLLGQRYFGGWFSDSGYYRTIEQSYSLVNEGLPAVPAAQAHRFREIQQED